MLAQDLIDLSANYEVIENNINNLLDQHQRNSRLQSYENGEVANQSLRAPLNIDQIDEKSLESVDEHEEDKQN